MATRPERRPRDQDRRGAARCRPVFPFGIGTKAANRSLMIVRSLPYLTTPVSPFHAEPLQPCRSSGVPHSPPGSAPGARRRAATGSGRRSRAESSKPRNRRLSFLATASVVPLPPKGSSTISPGFEHARMIRPRSCSGIWQPCQPARSLKVPQTRGKYQVSLSGAKPSGTSCGRRIQVSSGSRPLGLARRVEVDQLPRRGDADRLGR